MRLFKVLLFILIVGNALAQNEFINLDDGAELYVEEAGEGQALIFIPGWTMTQRFFEKQKAFFSDKYRFISYDPRGQGRSDKTSTKNTYADHANDLRQLLIKKELDEIVLIGWSSGCLTMYEYLRQYGTDRINKMVFIDEPPKWIGDRNSEWVYGNFDDYRGSLKGLISEPADPDGIIDWMLNEPINKEDRSWMKKEMLMTSRDVAIRLYIDGLISDYTDEVVKYTSKVPSLFMVRSSWIDNVRNWLSEKSPEAEVRSISSHAMFWEKPEKFNKDLLRFITSSR